MKKKIFTIGLIVAGMSANAQVEDSVSVGAGYVNESYYSFEDGEVMNVDNGDWDLAFDVSNFGAAIRVNRRTEVYLYNGPVSDWETLDTAGIAGWTRYYNSDLYWSGGALNAAADEDDATDLGWGSYNTTTHFTEGTRIFVAKLQSGVYKKFFIEELGMGTYTFKYDELDNSDLVNETILKTEYNTMNFIHYSLDTKEVISREPNSSDWDIVFSNYHSEIIPDSYYGVTGVLVNRGVETQEVTGVPVSDASFTTPFDTEINIIGYDWKSFNFGTFSYDIADSLTYFVHTNSDDVWKLVLTGFNGSSDGKIYFTKELVSAVGVDEEANVEMLAFPNPATNVLNVKASEEIGQVNLYNMGGQLVYSNSSVATDLLQIEVAAYEQGVYMLEIELASGGKNVQRVIIAE